MTEKNFVFKIDNKIVEIVDWDITIDEMEAFKQNVAIVNGVATQDIQIDTIEVFRPPVSDTTAISSQGLMYKAPNPYSVYRPIKGLKFSSEIETRRFPNGIEIITDEDMNLLFEKIVSNRVDEVIIYS